MPLTRLADAYKEAGFHPSDENVRRIQEAGEAALSGWAASRVPELCRLALGMPLGAATAEWFMEPFQEADRAFTGSGDSHRASVYASGLAAEMLARQNTDSVQLAFGLMAGSLSNRRPSPAVPGLVAAAQSHLGAVQKAWRARPRITLPKLPALEAANLAKVADSLAANQFPQAAEGMKAFATSLTAHLKGLADQASLIEKVVERLGMLDEEQATLWWFEAGASRDLDRSFSSMPLTAAAVVAGHELADMRFHKAGPVGTPAVLEMVLSAGRKRERSGASPTLAETSWADVPVEWRARRGARARDKGCLDLCPLSAALLLSAEAGDAPDWQAAFARSHPAASAARLTPVEIAVQANREACFLSIS